jgi:hypothetical protein
LAISAAVSVRQAVITKKPQNQNFGQATRTSPSIDFAKIKKMLRVATYVALIAPYLSSQETQERPRTT